MVIIPSYRKCQVVVGALRVQCPGLRTSLIWRGDTRVVPADVYVCTAVVDAGITIPDVTHVLDSGVSVGRKGGKMGTWPSSRAVADQRAGRTGRTCNGTYVRLTVKYDETKFDFSPAFAANHWELARTYGERREFPKMEEMIPWLPGLYNDWVKAGDFGACFFWWRLGENHGDLVATEQDFMSARLEPGNEKWGFVFKLFGEVNLPRFDTALARVARWRSREYGGNWLNEETGRVEYLELPSPTLGTADMRRSCGLPPFNLQTTPCMA